MYASTTCTLTSKNEGEVTREVISICVTCVEMNIDRTYFIINNWHNGEVVNMFCLVSAAVLNKVVVDMHKCNPPRKISRLD